MWLLLRACPPLSFTANILEQQSKAGLIYFKVLQAGGGEFLLSLQCDSFQEKQKLVYEAEDFLIYILYQYVSKMINITVVITFLSVYMVASWLLGGVMMIILLSQVLFNLFPLFSM